MNGKKISDLLPSDATRIASECEKKGLESLKNDGWNILSNPLIVHHIGLCQKIYELEKRIEKLESNRTIE